MYGDGKKPTFYYLATTGIYPKYKLTIIIQGNWTPANRIIVYLQKDSVNIITDRYPHDKLRVDSSIGF